jgi:hypothetical protein
MKTFKNFYDNLSDLRAKNNVRAIFNLIDGTHRIEYPSRRTVWEYFDDAPGIFEIVAKYGQGFVTDICDKALHHNIRLSEKQRWCVAFAMMKVTDEQIAEYREWEQAELAALDAEIEASEQNEAEQAAEPAEAEEVTAEESKNDKEFDNQTTDNDMKASDIRLINDNQESGRVFFHTYDGKTICRTMTSREVQQGQVLRRREGEKACTNYFVDLFNNKYSEPQKIEYRRMSEADTRFFWLHHCREINPLPFDEEEEYQRLLSDL